jgi:hypothetical protein
MYASLIVRVRACAVVLFAMCRQIQKLNHQLIHTIVHCVQCQAVVGFAAMASLLFAFDHDHGGEDEDADHSHSR